MSDLKGIHLQVGGEGGMWGNFGQESNARDASRRQRNIQNAEFLRNQQQGLPPPPQQMPTHQPRPPPPRNAFEDGGPNGRPGGRISPREAMMYAQPPSHPPPGQYLALPPPSQSTSGVSIDQVREVTAKMDLATRETADRVFGVENFNRMMWEEVAQLKRNEEDSRRVLEGDVRSLAEQMSVLSKHVRREDEQLIELREKVLHHDLERNTVAQDMDRRAKSAVDTVNTKINELENRVGQSIARLSDRVGAESHTRDSLASKLTEQDSTIMQLRQELNLVSGELSRQISEVRNEQDVQRHAQSRQTENVDNTAIKNMDYVIQEQERSIASLRSQLQVESSARQKIERDYGNLGDEFRRIVDNQEHQLRNLVEQRVSSLAQAMQQSKEETMIELQNRHHNIRQSDEAIDSVARSNAMDKATMNDRLLIFEKALQDERSKRMEMERNIKELLDHELEAIESKVESGDHARSSMDNVSHDQLRKLVGSFQETLNQLQDEITNVDEFVRAEAKARMESEERVDDRIGEKVKTEMKRLTSLDDRVTELENERGKTELVKDRFRKEMMKLTEPITRSVADLEDLIEQKKKFMGNLRADVDSLNVRLAHVDDVKLNDLRSHFETMINETVSTTRETMTESMKEMVTTAVTSSDGLKGTVDDLARRLAQEIDVRTREDDDIRKMITDGKKRMDTKFEKMEEKLYNEIGQRAADIERLGERLGDHSEKMNDMMRQEEHARQQAIENLNRQLEKGGAENAQQRERMLAQLEKKIKEANNAKELVDRTDQRLRDLINTHHEAVMTRFADQEKDLENNIGRRLGGVETSVKTLQDDLSRAGEDLSKLGRETDKNMKTMDEGRKQLESSLGQRIDTKVEAVDRVLESTLGIRSQDALGAGGGLIPPPSPAPSMVTNYHRPESALMPPLGTAPMTAGTMSMAGQNHPNRTLPQRLAEMEHFMDRLLGQPMKDKFSTLQVDPTSQPIYPLVETSLERLKEMLSQDMQEAIQALLKQIHQSLGLEGEGGPKTMTSRVNELESMLECVAGRDTLNKIRGSVAAAQATGQATTDVPPIYHKVDNDVDVLRQEMKTLNEQLGTGIHDYITQVIEEMAEETKKSITGLVDNTHDNIHQLVEQLRPIPTQIDDLQNQLNRFVGPNIVSYREQNPPPDDIFKIMDDKFMTLGKAADDRIQTLADEVTAANNELQQKFQDLGPVLEEAIKTSAESVRGDLAATSLDLNDKLQTTAEAVDSLVTKTRDELENNCIERVTELGKRLEQVLGQTANGAPKPLATRVTDLEDYMESLVGPEVMQCMRVKGAVPAVATMTSKDEPLSNPRPATVYPIYHKLQAEMQALRTDLDDRSMELRRKDAEVDRVLDTLTGREILGAIRSNDTHRLNGFKPVYAKIDAEQQALEQKMKELASMLDAKVNGLSNALNDTASSFESKLADSSNKSSTSLDKIVKELEDKNARSLEALKEHEIDVIKQQFGEQLMKLAQSSDDRIKEVEAESKKDMQLLKADAARDMKEVELSAENALRALTEKIEVLLGREPGSLKDGALRGEKSMAQRLAELEQSLETIVGRDILVAIQHQGVAAVPAVAQGKTDASYHNPNWKFATVYHKVAEEVDILRAELEALKNHMGDETRGLADALHGAIKASMSDVEKNITAVSEATHKYLDDSLKEVGVSTRGSMDKLVEDTKSNVEEIMRQMKPLPTQIDALENQMTKLLGREVALRLKDGHAEVETVYDTMDNKIAQIAQAVDAMVGDLKEKQDQETNLKVHELQTKVEQMLGREPGSLGEGSAMKPVGVRLMELERQMDLLVGSDLSNALRSNDPMRLQGFRPVYDKVGDVSDEAKKDVKDANRKLEESNHVLQTKIQDIMDKLAMMDGEIGKRMSGVERDMAEAQTTLASKMIDSSSGMENNLTKLSEELKKQLEASLTDISNQSEQGRKKLEEDVSAAIRGLQEKMDSDLSKSLADLQESKTVTNKHLEELSTVTSKTFEEMNNKNEKEMNELIARIESMLGREPGSLKSGAMAGGKNVNDRIADLEAALKAFESMQVEQAFKAVEENLNQTHKKIEEISATHNNSEIKLSESVRQVDQRFNEFQEQVGKSMAEELEKLKNTIDGLVGKDMSSFGEALKEFDTRFQMFVGPDASVELANAASNPARGFTNIYKIIESVAEKLAKDQEEMVKEAKGQDSKVEQLAQETEKSFKEATDQMDRKIADMGMQINTYIEKMTKETTTESNGKLEAFAREMQQNLEQLLKQFQPVAEEVEKVDERLELALGRDFYSAVKNAGRGSQVPSIPQLMEQELKGLTEQMEKNLNAVRKEIDDMNIPGLFAQFGGQVEQQLEMQKAESMEVVGALATKMEDKIIAVEERVKKNEQIVIDYNDVYKKNFASLQETVAKLG